MDDDNVTGKSSELTSSDERNKVILENDLREIGVQLPYDVVEQLTFLGRESEERKGSFVSYEVDQIYACLKHPEIKTYLFQNGEPIKVRFGDQDYQITPETYEDDIKWIIILNDIGKAGWNKDSRGIITTLYNDIHMRDNLQGSWLKQHGSEARAMMERLEVAKYAPEKTEEFIKAFEEGRMYDVPISVMVEVCRRIAESDTNSDAKTAKLSISDNDTQILERGGVDPRVATMRDFYDGHVRWGETYLKDNILDPRKRMLTNLGLMHHFSQGYLPESFDTGELQLDQNGFKLVAFLEFLDKADAFMKRSGHEPKELKDRVMQRIKSQVKDDGDGEKLRLLAEVAESFDWAAIGLLLDERRNGVKGTKVEAEQGIETKKKVRQTGKQGTVPKTVRGTETI